MKLVRSLSLVLTASLLAAGCGSASDEASAQEQATQQKQAALAGWAQPELIPAEAAINDVSPSEDGLAVEAKGEFSGDPKTLADSIHESRLAEGWAAGLVVDQESQYYMTYEKDGALLIYDLSYNQEQRLITVSYLPAESAAG